MAKKQKQEQPEAERKLNRRESRLQVRQQEQNRKLFTGVGIAVGLAVLVLIFGAIFEFGIRPSRTFASVGDAQITNNEFWQRSRLEQNGLLGQLVRFQQMDQQFGGQGFFAQQIGQLEAVLASPDTLGIQVLEQLVNEKIALQEASNRGIVVGEAEVDMAIREEIASGQGAVTEAQATQTASVAEQATATAESWTPTPTPTIDVNSSITTTEVITTPLPPTPLPLLNEASYQEGLSTLESNISRVAEMDVSEYREIVHARLVSEKLQEILGTELISDTEEQVHARHILLRVIEPTPTATPVPDGEEAPEPTETPTVLPEDEPTPTPTAAPRNDEETLALAEEIRQRIVDDGEDFEELAAEYSDDLSNANNGGDLDWFGTGAMVPEFEEAAFGLEVGTVSEPVKTSFGYHLIEVLEKDATRPKEESRLSQERQQAYAEWLREQSNNIDIQRPDNIVGNLPPELRRGTSINAAPAPVQNSGN